MGKDLFFSFLLTIQAYPINFNITINSRIFTDLIIKNQVIRSISYEAKPLFFKLKKKIN